MESRKIQRVGASTLSVSLPKDWVVENHLEKGDLLLFEPMRDGSLRVVSGSQGQGGTRPEDVVWLVNADLCEERGMLSRVIVGCYVIGRSSIRIVSKSRIRSEHLAEARSAVSKLHGLGIMTETSTEMELQCAIDPTRFPIETVMKRLYTIGSTMQKEAIEALERGDKRLAEDAMSREDEADRMYWLTLRLLLSAQTSPQIAEEIGIHDQLPIVGNRLIAKNLEHVADYANNVALSVAKLLEHTHPPDATLVRRFRKASDLSATIVADALSCIFSHDMKLGNRAIETQAKVEALEGEIEESIAKVEDPTAAANLRAIGWSLRRIAEYGSEIAVIGINRYLERPSAICRPLEPEGGKPARR
ncbi:MAG: PhoU domain-containing protein [Thermoplasmatota archaeon]